MERSHLCFQPGFPLTVITFRTVFLSLLSPWRQNITMVTYLMLIWLRMISLWWQNVPCLIENLRKHIEPPQAFYPHLECLGLHLDFLRRLAKLAYCIQCSKQINTFNVTLCCVHYITTRSSFDGIYFLFFTYLIHLRHQRLQMYIITS